jgi:hypothetical protein
MDTFYPRCAVIEEANRPESAGMIDMLQQVTTPHGCMDLRASTDKW